MATKKTSKAKPRQRRVELTQHAEQSLVSLLTRRLRPFASLAVTLTALAAFFGAVYGGWNWLGGPLLVTDRQMGHAIDQVKTKIGEKVDQVKREVTSLSNKNTQEVKEDVSGVKQQITALAHKSDTTRVAVLELQQRTLFLQKTQMQANLVGVESQLREHPTDSMLLQRRSEINNVLEFVNRELTNVSDQLRRVRNGE